MNTGISILHQLVVWDCWTINYVSLEICCNQKISGILSSPEFPVVKKKEHHVPQKRAHPPKTSPNLKVHPLVPPMQPCCRAQDHAQRLLRRAGPGLGAAGRAGSAAFRRSWSGLHLNVRRAERVRVTLGSPFLYRPCMAICTYIWLIFMVKCR